MFSNKEFAIISYLRFISMTNFMLSSAEHEKMFITSEPDHDRGGIKLMTVRRFIVESLSLSPFHRLDMP